MYIAGVPYQLVGPSGLATDTAVWNDRTSPYAVGFLRAEDGITGLMDAPPTREAGDDLPSTDGGYAAPGWAQRRAGTLNAFLDGELSAAGRAAQASRIKRASRGMRGDCQLLWTPPVDAGSPIPRRLLVRRQTGPIVTGRSPWTVQVGMVSAYPWIESQAEHSVSLTFPNAPSSGGPFVSVVNAGDAPAGWRIAATGPLTNLRLELDTPEGSYFVVFDGSDGAGRTVAANHRLDAVLRQTATVIDTNTLLLTSTNAYDLFDPLASTWVPLPPGETFVSVAADGYSVGSPPPAVTFAWRDSWE